MPGIENAVDNQVGESEEQGGNAAWMRCEGVSFEQGIEDKASIRERSLRAYS